jgi:hypothetical protein
MYLVLSAFTSSPIFLVAANKASAFSFTVCTLHLFLIQHLITPVSYTHVIVKLRGNYSNQTACKAVPCNHSGIQTTRQFR